MTHARAKRVLSICRPGALLHRLLPQLEAAGLKIVPTFDRVQTLQLLSEQHFDAVVIGHMVPLEEQQEFIAKARRLCMPVVLLHDDGQPDLPADAFVPISDPAQLFSVLGVASAGNAL